MNNLKALTNEYKLFKSALNNDNYDDETKEQFRMKLVRIEKEIEMVKRGNDKGMNTKQIKQRVNDSLERMDVEEIEEECNKLEKRLQQLGSPDSIGEELALNETMTLYRMYMQELGWSYEGIAKRLDKVLK